MGYERIETISDLPLYRAAFDLNEAGVVILDPDGVIVVANSSWRNMADRASLGFGCAAEEGQDYLAAGAESTAAVRSAVEGVATVLAGTAPSYSVEFCVDTSPAPSWLSVRATRLPSIPGFAAVVHEDVSERVKAELALARQRSLLAEEVTDRSEAVDQATQALRSEGDQLRTYLESSPDATLIVDESGVVAFASTQVEAVFGYEEDELVGQPIETLLPERLREAHQGHRGSFFAAPAIRTMGDGRELYGRHKDGNEFPVEVSLSPVATDQGTLVLSTIRDQTNRRQIEKGLTGILEASLNEIYMFDARSLRFIQVNRGARQNLGYSMDEMRRMTAFDLKPEISEAEFDDLLRQARRDSETTVVFETVHIRKDGTLYPVEVHLQHMSFDGSPVYVAIILDVTERKRAQEQERLVQTTVEGIYGVDQEGNFTFCNAAMLGLLGYEHEDEVVGKNMHLLIHHTRTDGTEYPADECPIHQAFLANTHCHVDDEVMWCADGTSVQVEYWSHPIVDAGIVKGCIVSVVDISEREAALDLLRSSTALAEKATVTKSRFLAAASHDLRQPLQSVSLYLSALQARLDSQHARDIADKMQKSLGAMGALLDALLDISKLDSGAVVAEKCDFVLDEIIQRIHIANEPVARAKGLRFLRSGNDCVVHSDPALLERVVENFVTNAIRYTQKGEVELSCRCTGDTAKIMIRDTGIGIPDDELSEIFEEYHQLENSGRAGEKGLGLGLALVQHMARLLDHPVSVESTLGAGSTFSVEVPLSKSAHVAQEIGEPKSSEESNDQEASGRTVLLVDDDPAVLDATSILLEVKDFVVHPASDGAEALALLDSGLRPDVVVSDYRLPRSNGLEVIERVRESLELAVPAILMTGEASPERIKTASETDCTVLHKPVDPQELLSLLEEFCEG